MTHTIDVGALLREISPQAPCGIDVSSEITLTLEPEITGARGEPNWLEVRDRCVTLLTQKSKDLRATVFLTLSLLGTDGLPGLRDGLQVIHGLIAAHWKDLYPPLGPGQDPSRRIRAMEGMAPAGSDLFRFRQRLWNTPLTRSSTRTYSLRDWKIVKREIPVPDGTTPPTEDEITAAFQQSDKTALQTLFDAALTASESIRGIKKLLDDPQRGGKAPDLGELDKVLTEIRETLKPFLPIPADPSPTGTQSPTTEPKPIAPTASDIRSRADVLATLDRLSAYYRASEPSSLILPLLQQAREWVGKSFLEIYATVTPDPQEKTALLLSIKTPITGEPKK